MTHLDALNLRLSNERQRLALARSKGEREQRTVWVAQCEKEVAAERSFLGLPTESQPGHIDTDALLAELLEGAAGEHEAVEIDAEFFSNAILTQPGESLIENVRRERATA